MPSSHHIIVNVPGGDDRNTIFVAMPFSKTFDSLYSSIERAALQAGLTPVRTDINPGNIDFIQDIKIRIRTALIVLAVCIPEVKGGSPNPNVMYELGYAHSIGKSTIIITDDFDNLPSDIRNYQASKYTKGDESNPAFLGELTAQIWKAKAKIKEDGLTSKDFDDINGAHSRRLMLMNPRLEEYYVSIISFAQDIHQGYNGLQTLYISRLFSAANDLYTKSSSSQEEQSRLIKSYQDSWENYLSQYDYTSNDSFLYELPERKDKVEDAFRKLSEKSDLQTQQILRKNKEFFNTMINKLSSFQTLHIEFKKMDEKGFLASQFKDMQDLCFQTRRLSQSAADIISSANSLIRNFIHDFLRENEML